ncbi:MAG: DUF6364 family protein [Cyclobacteriaceae bacterium]|nr:DUF6364 family protein [Cyclobacteriaceae bacterium]
MKTKLTLTVKQNIIDSAKRLAKRRNVSVSRLFEEMFENDKINPIKTPEQLAAKKLLARVGEEYPIINQDDKELIRQYVSKKYS